MQQFTSYVARAVRFHELWAWGDWRIKVYTIAYGPPPPPSLIQAARELVATVLPLPAATSSRAGVGVLGVHAGRDANVVFTCWWEDENELRQHIWRAPLGCADRFTQLSPAAFAGCVWDLAVIGFERDAWVRTVLSGTPPDLQAYLSATLNADV